MFGDANLFLSCGRIKQVDVKPPPTDALIMAFRGNAEWSAAGTRTYDKANIVILYGQCNMHPRDDLDPKFPNARTLIVLDVESNHQFYWIRRHRFPAVSVMYLHAHPDSREWLQAWIAIRKDYRLDQERNVTIRFIKDSSDSDSISLGPSHAIKRRIKEIMEYMPSAEKELMQRKCLAIPKAEWNRDLRGLPYCTVP